MYALYQCYRRLFWRTHSNYELQPCRRFKGILKSGRQDLMSLKGNSFSSERNNSDPTPIIGQRFHAEMTRKGFTFASLARRICEHGGTITSSQLKRLTQGKRAQVGLDDLNIAFSILGSQSSSVFSTPHEESNLLSSVSVGLSKIIKERSDAELIRVLSKAFKDTEELSPASKVHY